MIDTQVAACLSSFARPKIRKVLSHQRIDESHRQSNDCDDDDDDDDDVIPLSDSSQECETSSLIAITASKRTNRVLSSSSFSPTATSHLNEPLKDIFEARESVIPSYLTKERCGNDVALKHTDNANKEEKNRFPFNDIVLAYINKYDKNNDIKVNATTTEARKAFVRLKKLTQADIDRINLNL